MPTASKYLTLIEHLRSIADIGLLYAKDEFDRDRYTELRQISHDMLKMTTEHTDDELHATYPPATDYPTAKVDVRGLLINAEGKILLVKETADGCWSLPGGWADVGYSPKETIVKEFKEETGLDITAERLLALFDKKMHPHPPQPFYVYKLVFWCTADSEQLLKGFDMLDVAYFDIDQLPPLSENRILTSQIEMAYHKVLSKDLQPYVD
jgi:ADP-ribose pyrophosphatase YjhB (NUDIX family)